MLSPAPHAPLFSAVISPPPQPRRRCAPWPRFHDTRRCTRRRRFPAAHGCFFDCRAAMRDFAAIAAAAQPSRRAAAAARAVAVTPSDGFDEPQMASGRCGIYQHFIAVRFLSRGHTAATQIFVSAAFFRPIYLSDASGWPQNIFIPRFFSRRDNDAAYLAVSECECHALQEAVQPHAMHASLQASAQPLQPPAAFAFLLARFSSHSGHSQNSFNSRQTALQLHSFFSFFFDYEAE